MGLRRLLLFYWRQSIASKLGERRSLRELRGFEAGHSELVDGKLSGFETELLHNVRDGTFFTRDSIGKFADGGDACPHCGGNDSREHRFLECVHYADIRERLGFDHAAWWECPAPLALHGLCDVSPFKTLFWTALESLHEVETFFKL